MIECSIEQLNAVSETVCILTLPAASSAGAVVQFAAFHLRKISRITFSDHISRRSAVIERCSDAFTFRFSGETIPITAVWLEAVAAMLTDVALYGWFAAAHIDAEFDGPAHSLSICVRVSPPA